MDLVAREREVRAGARALHGVMSHPHPLLRRVLNESLGELCWNDLMRFVERCDGALLAESIPDETTPAPLHLHEMRSAHDAADARD